MTQPEYEQKKRECWEEFKRTNLDGEVQWQPVSRYDVFCAAFDRAFALGKQEKDRKGKPLNTYITDEDKENVRAEYKAMVEAYESPRNNGEKEYAKGYMEALEWLFGIRFFTNDNK